MNLPVRRVWIGVGIAALAAGLAVAGAAGVFQLGFSSNGGVQAQDVPARRSVATTRAATTTTTTTAATTTTTTTAPPTTSPPATQAPAPTVAVVVVVATTAPPPAAATPGGVLAAANAQRGGSGLGALAAHGGLAGCAQAMANHMATTRSMTHSNLSCPLGAGAGTRVGEVLFSGTAAFSASFVVQYWMGSPTHKVHVMDPGYRFAGVGVAFAADGSMWVAMHFGG